ncbi:MAG: hypothetical protein KC493_05650 [Bacteriovoracaceae bacterium]|nr:hypothetical protein [Bacteriovoracaceae bacterium]
MKMTLILFCLMFLSSCLQEKEKIIFEREVLNSLPFSSQLLKLSPKVNRDSEILRPPNTWINLVETISLNENGENVFHCLFYKVTGKEEGVIRYITHNQSCFENYQDGSLTDLKKVTEFKFWIPVFDKKIFGKLLKRGYLYLIGKRDGTSFSIEIPLFNIGLKSNWKRFSNNLSDNIFKGVFVSKSLKPSSRRANQTLGKIADNYRDKKIEVCHEFARDCTETMSFRCDKCRYGWYSAIGVSTCPGQYIRFCGVNRCGERGQPACPRGIESARKMEIDNAMLCYDGSPLGFCRRGLKTVCDGRTLICL